LWVAVAFLRIGTDLLHWNLVSPIALDVELASWLFGFTLLWFHGERARASFAKGSRLLAGVLLAAWHAPLYLAAFLLMFHNAVAFVFWVHTARPGRERGVALASRFFLLVCALILFGRFDILYGWLEPQGESAFLRYDYGEMGRLLVPWSSDYHDWFHFFSCYAFGQALHYFVWLKAIPDQNLKTETTQSFRRSKELLLREFGRKTAWLLVAACAVSQLVKVMIEPSCGTPIDLVTYWLGALPEGSVCSNIMSQPLTFDEVSFAIYLPYFVLTCLFESPIYFFRLA
jgi:hypothetical protein